MAFQTPKHALDSPRTPLGMYKPLNIYTSIQKFGVGKIKALFTPRKITIKITIKI